MPAPPSPERYPPTPAVGGAPATRGLLRSYTCLACGARHASWAAFRAHRAGCRVTGPRAAPAAAAPPEGGRPEAPA
jgi:hypothetical protein